MHWSDYQMNEEYRKEMMRRAEEHRRVQSARQSRPSRRSFRFYRLLVRGVGHQMVAWGSYLLRSQDENLNAERQALPRQA